MKSICWGNFHLNCLHNAKETTWQTVYEQLQEIQDKIWIKRINEWLETVTDVWYWEHTYSVNKWEYQEWYYPISLSRVLSALGHWYWYDFSNQMIMFMKDSFIDGIYWYLLKEDKSDAMLDDQSDETIEALHKLLVRK